MLEMLRGIRSTKSSYFRRAHWESSAAAQQPLPLVECAGRKFVLLDLEPFSGDLISIDFRHLRLTISDGVPKSSPHARRNLLVNNLTSLTSSTRQLDASSSNLYRSAIDRVELLLSCTEPARETQRIRHHTLESRARWRR